MRSSRLSIANATTNAARAPNQLLTSRNSETEGTPMLSHQDNETLVRVGPGTPWDRCSGCSGFRFALEGPGRGWPAEAGDVARRRPGGVSRFAAARRSRRQCLRASRRADDVRPQRGLRLALRLSRLEIRRDGCGDRHAGRAGQEPVQGQGQDHGLSLQGTQRHGLGLYGPGDRRAAAAAERRMESRACGKCAGFNPGAGMQLAAGARRRDRFRACAHSAWPDRLQGRRSTIGSPSAICGRPSNASGRISG